MIDPRYFGSRYFELETAGVLGDRALLGTFGLTGVLGGDVLFCLLKYKEVRLGSRCRSQSHAHAVSARRTCIVPRKSRALRVRLRHLRA